MFQPSIETMSPRERASLQQERLEALVRERLETAWGIDARHIYGSIPRQETGKARRVWERTSDADPFRA
jgi:hypothetical protein